MTFSANEQRTGRIVEPTRSFTPGANRRPGAHRGGGARSRVPSDSRLTPDSVSVPAGAKAGDLILKPCSYATENGSYDADCRHAGRAREPCRPQLAADRAAGDSHPGSLGPPGGADLPPRGRSRSDQHGLRQGEPVRRRPRRRPRRLPRRRRLRPARLPGGRVGARATRPTSSARSPSARTPSASGPARSGSGTRASTSPATAWRSRSTISRPRASRSATTASTS